jgi:sigma-E factor negative regulatory protein RseC
MDVIRHSGIVSAVNARTLMVTIVSQSACSACHARGGCLASDSREKEIEVSHNLKPYHIGQQVTVVLKESSGIRALFYGYLFPFLVLVATLVVALHFSGNEVVSGLISLGMLIPYYTGLYLFRDKLTRRFEFFLEEN